MKTDMDAIRLLENPLSLTEFRGSSTMVRFHMGFTFFISATIVNVSIQSTCFWEPKKKTYTTCEQKVAAFGTATKAWHTLCGC